MRTRAVLGSIFASLGVLVIGWQAGNAAVMSATTATSTTTPTTTTSGGNSGTSSSGTSNGSNTTTSTGTTTAAPVAPTTGATDGTYAGSTVNTRFGPVQVQVTPRTTKPSVQLKGGQRTFGLFETKTFPKGAIFQRTGPGPGDLRTLLSYAQLQRERLIQRLMNLPKLAERIYAEKFKLYFERRFAGLTKTGKAKKPKAA